MNETLFLWLWGPFAVTFTVVMVLLINRFDLPRKHRHRSGGIVASSKPRSSNRS